MPAQHPPQSRTHCQLFHLGATALLALTIGCGGAIESDGVVEAEREAAAVADTRVGRIGGYKFLMYNTQMLPEIARVGSRVSVCRAEKIGAILTSPDGRNPFQPNDPINYDADVIALTETFEPEYRQPLMNKVAGKFPYRIENGLPANSRYRVSGGVSILSKYPIEKTDRIYFDELGTGCNMLDCLARKGVVWARITLDPNVTPPLQVDVYGTHFDSKSRPARQKQFAALNQFIQKTNANNRLIPVVILGDLNIGGTEFGTVAAPALNGPVDVWKALRPKEPGYTVDPANNEMVKRGIGNGRPDYILVYSKPSSDAAGDYRFTKPSAVDVARFDQWFHDAGRGHVESSCYHENVHAPFFGIHQYWFNQRPAHFFSDHYGVMARLEFWSSRPLITHRSTFVEGNPPTTAQVSINPGERATTTLSYGTTPELGTTINPYTTLEDLTSYFKFDISALRNRLLYYRGAATYANGKSDTSTLRAVWTGRTTEGSIPHYAIGPSATCTNCPEIEWTRQGTTSQYTADITWASDRPTTDRLCVATGINAIVWTCYGSDYYSSTIHRITIPNLPNNATYHFAPFGKDSTGARPATAALSERAVRSINFDLTPPDIASRSATYHASCADRRATWGIYCPEVGATWSAYDSDTSRVIFDPATVTTAGVQQTGWDIEGEGRTYNHVARFCDPLGNCDEKTLSFACPVDTSSPWVIRNRDPQFDPRVEQISCGDALVRFWSNEPAAIELVCAATTCDGACVAQSGPMSQLSREHLVGIGGLDPGTRYVYRVRLVDWKGNVGETCVSTDRPAFVTTDVSATCTAPDRNAPQVIRQSSGGAGCKQWSNGECVRWGAHLIYELNEKIVSGTVCIANSPKRAVAGQCDGTANLTSWSGSSYVPYIAGFDDLLPAATYYFTTTLVDGSGNTTRHSGSVAIPGGTWSACVGATLTYGRCTEYCTSIGKRGSNSCTTSRGYPRWGTEAWYDGVMCGGSGVGQVESSYEWDDPIGAAPRWKCCCE